MTTVVISGTITSYAMGSPVNTLSITSTGYIDGSGVTGGTGSYSVVNSGRIFSATNDAVYLRGTGLVTNGSPTDTTARMTAEYTAVDFAGVGTVLNFGAMTDTTTNDVNAAVIYEKVGGLVTNGSSGDTTALIEGVQGVELRAAGTVRNFGSIIANGSGDLVAAYLVGGGSVINGSATDRDALMSGDRTVEARNAPVTVTNFGSIVGSGPYSSVALYDGGVITNGSAFDTSALIIGATGIGASELSTVTNFGTIQGAYLFGEGVALGAGGAVTNGSATDHGALIEGYSGVTAYGGASTIVNSGTILGIGANDVGVSLGGGEDGGGSFTNGAVNNTGALVQGYGGVRLSGSASGVNLGDIQGVGDGHYGSGLLLETTGDFINGSARDKNAVIAGYYGALVNTAVTLTNYGTISGASGYSLVLTVGATLVAEQNSVFVGQANLNGGALALAGDGTVGVSYYGVTLSNGGSNNGFYNGFGLDILSNASFTLSGSGTLGVQQSLNIAGALSAAGTITILGGAFVESGALTGAGDLNLESEALANFNTGTVLTIAKVTESGSSTTANFNGATITVGDVWTQTAGTVSVATGDRVNFTGTGDTFSGTLSGAGTVGFTGGTDTLSGTRIAAGTTLTSAASVTMSGAVDLTSTFNVTSPNLIIAAAGATLSGAGSIVLSNLATNVLKGATAGATLTNGNTIKGAGQLGDGQMVLINSASGVIDANLTTALVINTGASTVTNAGMIENAGAGGLTITGAVANTGTLNVTAGTLTVDGAVTGAGTVRISGGTADFGGAFTENVTFTTTGGVLELSKSQTYTGQITGFAKTPVSSLDLLDITFGGSTKATFSGSTTSGVLTVTDGTHTSKITLIGNYTASTFTVASDGHGGTTVTDPPKAPASLPPMLPLVTAMAGFGGGGGASHAISSEAWRSRPIALASPGIRSS